MIYEHFKISDTDDAVLDTSDLPNIELRGDSVQTFHTKWDETASAMQKQSDEQLLENLYFRRLEKSEQLKLAGRLAPPEHGSNIRTLELRRIEKDGGSISGTKDSTETFLYTRDRRGEKPNPVVSAVKGKGEEKAKGDCNQWVSKCHCSRAQACSVKHDRTKKGTERGARGGIKRQRSPLPLRRKSSETDGEQTGPSPSGATAKPLCFKLNHDKGAKEKTCLCWHRA